jgi:pyruvate dehydrogenase E1 component alpha subunit
MVSNDQLISFYENMLRIMLWEQKLLWLIDEGKAPSMYHYGRGQEAVAAGGCAALREDDYIMYDHRGCGHLIAKGLSLIKLFGDFLANTAGTTRGLGAGIVHIAWPELGILGQSGTLGGCFPLAAGAALSAKYRQTEQVCLCFFGDGTSNRGTFHEAANVASLWKLPVIWLCENNLYAISTPFRNSCAAENIADRAAAYAIPGIVVDGMDVVAVYEAVSEAVKRARAKEGPTLIEAKTYRFKGHSIGDAEIYRTKEEVEEWKKRDPISVHASKLIDKGIVNEKNLVKIQKKIQQEVDNAMEQALLAPMPPKERLFKDLYA